MATKILIFFTLLSFLSISSPLPTYTILDAANVLFNSGYSSMALIIELGSQSILPPINSLTIFSPSDTVFFESGQPPLSLLNFHFSPLSLSLDSLKSLPPGTKIPTLLANHSLIITSSPSDGDQVSINGVKINGSEIYKDGSFVIFGIDRFLDPDFEVSGFINGRPVHSFECSVLDGNGGHLFEEAIGALRSKGYSVMASFLDFQLAEFKDQTMLTIFAPVDEVMNNFIGDFRYYRSIFFRHFLPCKISRNDLVNFDNGVVLPTYLEGFMISLTKSGSILLVNGVEIIAPDLYNSSWLVVHGVRGSFVVQEKPHGEMPENSSTGSRSNDSETLVAPDFIFIISICFLFLCIF